MTSVRNEKQTRLNALIRNVATLYRQRWLIGYFVQRDLVYTYKGSYLGIFWSFVHPLFMIVLYTFVFSAILQIRFTDSGSPLNFGLYVYCGLIPYLAFSEAIQGALSTIRANATLVQKVVFPVEILPFTAVATNFTSQLFGLGGLILVFSLVERELHWTILLLPLVMVPQVLFTLGLGYVASVVGAFIPDIREIISVLLRALLFAVPILYPVSMVPEKYRPLIDLNPLTYLVEAYRDLILEGQIPDASWSAWFALLSVVVFIVGFIWFGRSKPKFADVI
jgi:ABC-type polysaccharide/polyol phosphate export permease